MKSIEAAKELLHLEVAKWKAKPWAAILAELHQVCGYQATSHSGTIDYQVEVELLEATEQDALIIVAIDDGTILGGLHPLTKMLHIRKDESDRE